MHEESVSIGIPLNGKIAFGQCEEMLAFLRRLTDAQELPFVNQLVRPEVQIEWHNACQTLRMKQVPGTFKHFQQIDRRDWNTKSQVAQQPGSRGVKASSKQRRIGCSGHPGIDLAHKDIGD